MKVLVIRTNGREERHEIAAALLLPTLERLLDAPQGFETVNIFKSTAVCAELKMKQPIMYVDDAGYETREVELTSGGTVNIGGKDIPILKHVELQPVRARKPVNERATMFYHAICIPGTTHKIVGDVAILDDTEFE